MGGCGAFVTLQRHDAVVKKEVIAKVGSSEIHRLPDFSGSSSRHVPLGDNLMLAVPSL